MELKAGSRWRSAVCDTEVVVVRAPSGAASLECGGQPMVPHDAEKPAGAQLDPAHSHAMQAGGGAEYLLFHSAGLPPGTFASFGRE